MSEHTPLPWEGRTYTVGMADRYGQASVIADLCPVAGVRSQEEIEANGEFIARACNCHDDLVAALVAFEAVDRRPAIGPIDEDVAKWEHFKKLARAALAKARGEQP